MPSARSAGPPRRGVSARGRRGARRAAVRSAPAAAALAALALLCAARPGAALEPHVSPARFFRDRGVAVAAAERAVDWHGAARAARGAFESAFDAYLACGFPNDDLRPLSCAGHDSQGGIAITLLDSLDSLFVFDQRERLEHALGWIEASYEELGGAEADGAGKARDAEDGRELEDSVGEEPPETTRLVIADSFDGHMRVPDAARGARDGGQPGAPCGVPPSPEQCPVPASEVKRRDLGEAPGSSASHVDRAEESEEVRAASSGGAEGEGRGLSSDAAPGEGRGSLSVASAEGGARDPPRDAPSVPSEESVAWRGWREPSFAPETEPSSPSALPRALSGALSLASSLASSLTAAFAAPPAPEPAAEPRPRSAIRDLLPEPYASAPPLDVIGRGSIHVFETTIRALGGLVSSHALVERLLEAEGGRAGGEGALVPGDGAGAGGGVANASGDAALSEPLGSLPSPAEPSTRPGSRPSPPPSSAPLRYRITPSTSRALLWHARRLGDAMLPACDTPTQLCRSWFLATLGVPDPTSSDSTCVACAGTLGVEFGALSAATGDGRYLAAADASTRALLQRASPLGLLGNTIHVDNGGWENAHSGCGAGADSFYEYLAKTYLLYGGEWRAEAFARAYAALVEHGTAGHDGQEDLEAILGEADGGGKAAEAPRGEGDAEAGRTTRVETPRSGRAAPPASSPPPPALPRGLPSSLVLASPPHRTWLTPLDADSATGRRLHEYAWSLSAFWPGLQVLAGRPLAALEAQSGWARAWRRWGGGVPEMFHSALEHAHPHNAGWPLRPEVAESALLLRWAEAKAEQAVGGEDGDAEKGHGAPTARGDSFDGDRDLSLGIDGVDRSASGAQPGNREESAALLFSSSAIGSSPTASGSRFLALEMYSDMVDRTAVRVQRHAPGSEEAPRGPNLPGPRLEAQHREEARKTAAREALVAQVKIDMEAWHARVEAKQGGAEGPKGPAAAALEAHAREAATLSKDALLELAGILSGPEKAAVVGRASADKAEGAAEASRLESAAEAIVDAVAKQAEARSGVSDAANATEASSTAELPPGGSRAHGSSGDARARAVAPVVADGPASASSPATTDDIAAASVSATDDSDADDSPLAAALPRATPRPGPRLPLTAFAELRDVRTGEVLDSFESFVLAETLRYLYLNLLGAEETFDFAVFSTEAHLFFPKRAGEVAGGELDDDTDEDGVEEGGAVDASLALPSPLAAPSSHLASCAMACAPVRPDAHATLSSLAPMLSLRSEDAALLTRRRCRLCHLVRRAIAEGAKQEQERREEGGSDATDAEAGGEQGDAVAAASVPSPSRGPDSSASASTALGKLIAASAASGAAPTPAAAPGAASGAAPVHAAAPGAASGAALAPAAVPGAASGTTLTPAAAPGAASGAAPVPSTSTSDSPAPSPPSDSSSRAAPRTLLEAPAPHASLPLSAASAPSPSPEGASADVPDMVYPPHISAKHIGRQFLCQLEFAPSAQNPSVDAGRCAWLREVPPGTGSEATNDQQALLRVVTANEAPRTVSGRLSHDPTRVLSPSVASIRIDTLDRELPDSAGPEKRRSGVAELWAQAPLLPDPLAAAVEVTSGAESAAPTPVPSDSESAAPTPTPVPSDADLESAAPPTDADASAASSSSLTSLLLAPLRLVGLTMPPEAAVPLRRRVAAPSGAEASRSFQGIALVADPVSACFGHRGNETTDALERWKRATLEALLPRRDGEGLAAARRGPGASVRSVAERDSSAYPRSVLSAADFDVVTLERLLDPFESLRNSSTLLGASSNQGASSARQQLPPFVLVTTRGDCSLDTKAALAASLNASGLLVLDLHLTNEPIGAAYGDRLPRSPAFRPGSASATPGGATDLASRIEGLLRDLTGNVLDLAPKGPPPIALPVAVLEGDPALAAYERLVGWRSRAWALGEAAEDDEDWGRSSGGIEASAASLPGRERRGARSALHSPVGPGESASAFSAGARRLAQAVRVTALDAVAPPKQETTLQVFGAAALLRRLSLAEESTRVLAAQVARALSEEAST